MPVKFDEFVSALVSAGENWVFAVEGADWHYVLHRIEKEFFPESEDAADHEAFGLLAPSDGGAPVCWANRARLPAEVVALRFGLTLAQVRAGHLIHLRPFPAPPRKPTVDYCGEA